MDGEYCRFAKSVVSLGSVNLASCELGSMLVCEVIRRSFTSPRTRYVLHLFSSNALSVVMTLTILCRIFPNFPDFSDVLDFFGFFFSFLFGICSRIFC